LTFGKIQMASASKRLHIVVHHRRDSRQPWSNQWLDDDRLGAITTTREIADLCAEAMGQKEEIVVHRCGWGDFAPFLCCVAEVTGVAQIDKRDSLVTFLPRPTGVSPQMSPHPGQNYYWA
jgi:hypothetical protein